MASLDKKEEKNKQQPALTNLGNSFTSANKKNSVSARIRKIGNSKGILLNNRIISESGIEDGAELIVTAEKNRIIITPAQSKRKINIDISTWEAQFKEAIKGGDKPETDLFEGMKNEFDKEEWQL
jgi:antitoxin component of MazEF toxin-antitoxin module